MAQRLFMSSKQHSLYTIHTYFTLQQRVKLWQPGKKKNERKVILVEQSVGNQITFICK